MTPAVENKLIWSGCLVALIGTAAFGYLAIKLNWAFGVVSVSQIPIWVFVSRHRANAEMRANLKALQEIIRPTGRAAPTLHRTGSYGYPGFTLIFSSKVDLDAAGRAGCIAAFKAFVQNRYADFGSKDNPFDAERAVAATYETTSEA